MTENGHAIATPTPLEALELGWSILPVNKAKKPMLTTWREFQSRQPTRAEVERWMKLGPAGWAIITGAISRRFTLDFDGEPGRRMCQALNLEPHRSTPHGGFHVDIEMPDWKIPTLSRIKAELAARWPATEIRATGGYVIFSGRIDGREYSWLRSTDADPISKLPQDLIEFLRPASEPAGEPAQPVPSNHLVDMALERAMQGRNAAGFWLATQLRDTGYTKGAAEIIIKRYRQGCPVRNTKGEPEEYTEAEALASLEQAYGRGPREPWSKKPSEPAPAPAVIEPAAVVPVNGHSAETSHAVADETPRTPKNHFLLTSNAVFYTDEETESKIYVCSHLEVLALARDQNSESWGRLLKWTDAGGKTHTWIAPMRMLAGDGIQFRETLQDAGLDIGASSKSKSLLVQYVLTERPSRFMYCVPHVGWFERAYVFPDSTVPAAAEVGYQSAGRGEHFYRTRGTLESWQEQVSRKCAGNSRLTFAVSIAFAGPLLRLLNVGGGGFHFRGTSSIGKSTTQWAAGSIYGGGGRNGFARTWSSTKNAIESIAELHNDGCLILDEIRQIDPREVEQIVYTLANGSGKSRETRNLTGRRTLQWLCMILSSGEIQLSDCAALAGQKVKGGAEIRMATIPADAGAGMGIFENLHGADEPRVFAETLEAAAKENYGTAILAYLERLLANRETVQQEGREFIEAFIQESLEERRSAAPEIRRVLRRFALCAFAGEFASEHSITGWEEGEAQNAARICAEDWIRNRGGIESTDTLHALRQIRSIITQQPNRFRAADPPKDAEGKIILEERIANQLGYWKIIKDELVYLADQDAFRKEMCAGFDPEDTLKDLRNRNLLYVNEPGKFTTKAEITLHTGNVTRRRFVGILAKIQHCEDF